MTNPRAVVYSRLVVVLCLASQCFSEQSTSEKSPNGRETRAEFNSEQIPMQQLPESFPYWRKNANETDVKVLDHFESERRATCKCDDSDIYSQLEQLQEFRRTVRVSPGMCYVGIFNGLIKQSQLRASSMWNQYPYLQYAGPFSADAWCAGKNDGYQWIQVDLFSPKTITGVATQGRASYSQWVQSYHVLYGNSVNNLMYYMEHGAVKVFPGNKDKNTIVENMFSKPITARYVRIHPVAWYGHISMRFELRQC